MTQSIDGMINFFLREKGEPIQLNGIQQIALIMDATDHIQYEDDKLIRMAIEIKTGDLIVFRNERYLIISKIDHNENSYRGRMRKCNYLIAFNWIGNVKWFDAIVEGKTFSIETGTVMSLPVGNINVYLQDNSDTRDIGLNKRFYNTLQPFNVSGIDQTVKGITKLNCILDIKAADDDIDNNIADRWKYEVAHTYALTIDNGTTANVLINDILQLNSSSTDNGSIILNPGITYSSSDPNVVSVDNQGKVMGIQAGQTTINASLTYHPTVVDTILITTVETVTHIYTISITGNPTIKIGQSASYVSHIYDNGTEVFDQSVQWSMRNQDNSTPIMVSITASTGNSATVKIGNQSSYVSKYIDLSATLTGDPSIIIEKSIQIKSLI
jgi:hypothetical protein